jgi:type II secretory pathway component PulJ
LENVGVSGRYQLLRTSCDAKNGFILLEALVAMSLISGVWMASVQSYQTLSLSLMRQEQQREQIRKAWDVFELSVVSKGVSGESARMSGGVGSVHAPLKSSSQNKR